MKNQSKKQLRIKWRNNEVSKWQIVEKRLLFGIFPYQVTVFSSEFLGPFQQYLEKNS